MVENDSTPETFSVSGVRLDYATVLNLPLLQSAMATRHRAPCAYYLLVELYQLLLAKQSHCRYFWYRESSALIPGWLLFVSGPRPLQASE